MQTLALILVLALSGCGPAHHARIPSDSGISGTGYLQGSQVSGLNRICLYDLMGSAYAHTMRATRICPVMIRP